MIETETVRDNEDGNDVTSKPSCTWLWRHWMIEKEGENEKKLTICSLGSRCCGPGGRPNLSRSSAPGSPGWGYKGGYWDGWMPLKVEIESFWIFFGVKLNENWLKRTSFFDFKVCKISKNPDKIRFLIWQVSG